MMGSMFPYCKFCMKEYLVICLKYLSLQLVIIGKLICRQLVTDWEGILTSPPQRCVICTKNLSRSSEPLLDT